MEHIKFPSINQLKNVIINVKHRIYFVGKDENDDIIYDYTRSLPILKYQGTVKLHGTNAAVVCGEKGDDIYFQSRTNIITPLKDNAGFAFWANQNKDIFKEFRFDIMVALSRRYIFEYDTKVIFYGEWCGGNIQSGVAINGLPKMFVIFKIKVGDIWLNMEEFSHIDSPEDNIFNIQNFKTFDIEIDFNNPQDAQNKLIEITEEVERECPVGKYFGKEGIGEGIVWSCIEEDWNSSAYIFKVKGEKHSVSKVKKLAQIDTEKVNSIKEFVQIVVTENRMNQGLDYLKENNLEFDVKNTGTFLKWLYQDIIKEESDVIVESGLEPKDVGSSISAEGKKWYFEQLNKIF